MTSSERRNRGVPDSTATGRLLSALALLSVAATLGCPLLATLVSPSFAWREHALSNLGVTSTDAGTGATVLLFNGGLVVGGLVGVAFCALLFRRTNRRADRTVAGLAGTALAALGLVGVFRQGTALHLPVAALFFLLVSATLWVAGGVRYRAGSRRRGLVVLAGGTANLLVWLLWFALPGSRGGGLAIPEMVGAVIFGGWLCAFALQR